MTSDFKGIWIPIELIDLNISWTKRILIAEISQLEMLDKGCIASNAHFATKLKLSKQAVSKALNELAKENHISICNAQTKRNFGRTITINLSKSAINLSKSAINLSKSAINLSKSGVHESGESKGVIQVNKTINKTINTKSSFETFINATKEKFAINKINSFSSKINQVEDTKLAYKALLENSNIDLNTIVTDYVIYVKANKNMSARLNKYLWVYSENNLNSLPILEENKKENTKEGKIHLGQSFVHTGKDEIIKGEW